MNGIGNGMNAKNTIRVTIFSEQAEQNIVGLLERVVDHFTSPLDPPATAFNPGRLTKREKEMAKEISVLERLLAEANAKVSRRL